jgi:hypothetical protein
VTSLRPLFKLTSTLLIGSGVLACTCAAYDVDVGHLWGTLMQVTGLRHGISRPEVIVSAGQALRVEAGAVIVEDMPAEAVTQRLAWAGVRLQDGWVAFQGQTLESVVQEFNRHNERQLVIGDLAIGQLRIGGKFRVSDIDGFLAALALTHHVKAAVAPAVEDRPQLIILTADRSGSARPEGPGAPPELTRKPEHR